MARICPACSAVIGSLRNEPAAELSALISILREQGNFSMTSSGLDYLSHIAAESARFAQALAGARDQAAVPTCPGWNADDLLWHLGEVQWFWGTIVRDGVDARAAGEMKPPRPATRPGL